jgi:hypothetical protein
MTFLRRVCLLGLLALLPGFPPAFGETERLVRYYQSLLEKDPENPRARAFLARHGALPAAPTEGISSAEPTESMVDPRSAILELWREGSLPAARAVLQDWWGQASPTRRLQAGFWALQNAPSDELPWIAKEVDGWLAPDDPRRREVSALLGENLDSGPVTQALAASWRETLFSATEPWTDPRTLVTATIWFARHGDEEAWLRALLRAAELEPNDPERIAACVSALAIRPAWPEEFLRWTQRWAELEAASFELLLARMENALHQNDEATALSSLQAWQLKHPSLWNAARRQQLRSFADRLHWREGKQFLLATPAYEQSSPWADTRDLVESHLQWLEPALALELATAWMEKNLPATSPSEPALEAIRAEQGGELADLFLRLLDPATALPFAAQAWAAAQNSEDSSLQEKSLLRFSELHQLTGNAPQARAVLEEWLARDETRLPPASLDRRLFDLHERASGSMTGVEESSPAPQSSLALGEFLPGKPGRSPGLQKVLDHLRELQQSGSTPSLRETASLRLSRFLRWARQPHAAALACQRGLHEFPDSIPLREESIALALELLDTQAAREHRRALITIDAERADEHRRLYAMLLLETGETAAALEIFDSLRRENPAMARPWIDHAHALNTAEQRFASMELLWEGLQTAPSEDFRLELWPEAWQAARHVGRAETLADWLRSHLPNLDSATAQRWQEHIGTPLLTAETAAPPESATLPAGQADSFPSTTALLKTLGARDAALWLASAPSPHDPRSLAWWQEAATRFPRQPSVLRRAAHAAQAAGQPRLAAPLLTRAVELEPPAPVPLLEAAQLHLTLGNRLEALEIFEKILSIPPGATPPGRPLFPEFPLLTTTEKQQAARLVFRLRGNAGPWNRARAALVQESHPQTAASPQLESHRIAAIHGLSELALDSPEIDSWCDRWLALPDLPEKIHGLLALGEQATALSVLADTVQSSRHDYATLRAFLELALEMGELNTALSILAESGEEIPERTDLFLSALSKRTQENPFDRTTELDTALTEHPSLVSLRWPIAQLLAQQKDWAAAVQIGRPALAHMPPEALPTAQLDLLSWMLQRQDLAAAEEFFTSITVPEGSDFTDPALSLERVRWILASPSERETMQETAAEETAAGSAEAALRLFLFAALSRENNDELSALAAALVQRRSAEAFAQQDPYGLANFLRSGAEQLLQWRLPAAARILLAAGLEADEAMLTLRGQLDTYQRAELQMMALALEIEEAPPSTWRDLLAAWWTGHQDRDFFLALAGRLELHERPAAALAVLEKLAATEWNLPTLPESALRVAQNSGDSTALLRWLPTTSDLPLIGQNQGPTDDAALAALTFDALLANGEFRSAQAFLEEANRSFPQEEAIKERTLQLVRLQGDQTSITALLEARWVAQPTVSHGLDLLTQLWQTQEWEKAASLWEILHEKAPEALSQWGAQALQHKFAAEPPSSSARWLLDRPAEEAWLPPVPHLAALLETESWPEATAWLIRQAGGADWGALLQEVARHPQSPVELLETAHQATQNFPRPDLPGFWTAAAALANRLDRTEEWRDHLAAEWQNGEGPLWAAEMLLQLPPDFLTPALRLQILGQFLAREPSATALAGLAEFLEKKGDASTALPVRQENLRRFPEDAQARLQLARLQWMVGRPGDARTTLEPWTKTAELFPELLPTLLETALARDNWPEVRFWAERGLRFGLPRDHRRFLVAKASACAQLGDWATARELFTEACAIPGHPSPAHLLNAWIDAHPTLLTELRPLLRPQDDTLFATLRAQHLAAAERWGDLALWLENNPSLAHHPGLTPLQKKLDHIARTTPSDSAPPNGENLEAGRR